ncbi:MAG TPA: helix-hairpin-helix domain-containing protein [Acidimicrobiia bacterium]|nr:helix-hairpin-helix domain-containing protein [Acidimicrobiia bacterium]
MEVPPLRSSLTAGVLALVALIAGCWWSGRAPEPPPLVVAPVATRPEHITVHVSGAVRRPGLIEIVPEARVADAVAAAGGATPDADLSSLNLAGPVVDGARVVVPARGSTAARPAGGEGPIRVNQATAEELERIPGVGPVLAERIVAHREAHGPFSVVEDLLDVPGIGEGKLAAIRDDVAVP